MVPNSIHLKQAVFGAGGVIEGISSAALYIDMNTINEYH
jgi:3-hydroxyisobutyrate dehydrogenase-like beta-hydroxyacid dehydrogenase